MSLPADFITETEGDGVLCHAISLASLDGDRLLLEIELDVLGGVRGRVTDFILSGFELSGTSTSFLIGSVSSLFFSNIDIRAFVGGIEVISVVKSRLVTELAALLASGLDFGCLLTGCWACGCD